MKHDYNFNMAMSYSKQCHEMKNYSKERKSDGFVLNFQKHHFEKVWKLKIYLDK